MRVNLKPFRRVICGVLAFGFPFAAVLRFSNGAKAEASDIGAFGMALLCGVYAVRGSLSLKGNQQ